MKPTLLCLLLISFTAALGAQRESFDVSWQFSRFGKLADGSGQAEPLEPAKTPAAIDFDVANFARRDRNHPSVIAWSTGNELPEQKDKKHVGVSEKLTKLFRLHDPTRKVTLGINYLGAALTPFADSVDLVGLNYPVKNGKEWAQADRSTTGALSQLRVEADRTGIKADGRDLSYITITCK